MTRREWGTGRGERGSVTCRRGGAGRWSNGRLPPSPPPVWRSPHGPVGSRGPLAGCAGLSASPSLPGSGRRARPAAACGSPGREGGGGGLRPRAQVRLPLGVHPIAQLWVEALPCLSRFPPPPRCMYGGGGGGEGAGARRGFSGARLGVTGGASGCSARRALG